MAWRDRLAWTARDADIHAEIESHLQLAAQERLGEGYAPDQAVRAARLELGSPSLVREDTRAVWVWPTVESLLKDVTYGVRSLQRQPQFTVVAILTLAIGIGATTAIFSLVNTVFLRPLRVADAERLVRLVGTSPSGVMPNSSLPRAIEWLRLAQTGVFAEISAHRLDLINFTGSPAPEQISVARVTKDFFRIFGAPMIAGRTFLPEDDRPAGPHVAVLSHGLWARQFGGAADTVGRTIVLGSDPYVVVGILAQEFDTEQFDPRPDVWVPFQLDPNTQDVGGEWCFVTARLKPGASVAAANAQLATVAADYRRVHPEMPQGGSFAAQALRTAVVGPVGASLRVLAVAVVLVLLIACANVASLLLIRGTGRVREITMRAALGAGRRRLMRQLLTESGLIALGGAVCGLAVGLTTIRALVRLYRGDRARADSADWRRAPDPLRAGVACRESGFRPASRVDDAHVDLGHAI